MNKTSKITLANEDPIELWEDFQRAYYVGHEVDSETLSVSRIVHDELPPQTQAKKHIRKYKLKDYRKGKVYKYSKGEVAAYNIVLLTDGPEAAKAWADRRWHERAST